MLMRNAVYLAVTFFLTAGFVEGPESNRQSSQHTSLALWLRISLLMLDHKEARSER